MNTILIVDDQPELRDGLGLTLSAFGYHTLVAADGYAALDLLQQQPVHLILADIGMPRMNGYQLYERVCADPRWLRIPFIFLTARGMDSDIRYGKELGVDDYLVKPVEPEDLLAVVAGRLRKAAQLAQVLPQNAQYEASDPESDDHQLGKLRMSTRQRRVWMGDQEIDLSAREFDLLDHLLRHAGEVVTLRDMVRVSHNIEVNEIEAGALMRPVMRLLRRKLGYNAGELGCIENVRGVGYRLIEP